MKALTAIVISALLTTVFPMSAMSATISSIQPPRFFRTQGASVAAAVLPLVALTRLPRAARVDRFSQFYDQFNRPMVWAIRQQRWMSFDSGMLLDPSEPAPSLIEYASREQSLSASRRGVRPNQFCAFCKFASGGDTNVRWEMDNTPAPPADAHKGPDGNWYDPSGVPYTFIPSTGGWAKTIGNVQNVPPSMQIYVTTYNFFNGLAPWFYGFATAGPLFAAGPFFGQVPWAALSAHMTARGAALFGALTEVQRRTMFQANALSNLTLTAEQVNSELPYSNPPFASGTLVENGLAEGSFLKGQIGNTTLVRVGATSDIAENGPWIMPASSIQTATGAWMSPAEIQDLYSLPAAPLYVAKVATMNYGADIFMGQASAVTGWGSGGGVQFFVDRVGGMIFNKAALLVP